MNRLILSLLMFLLVFLTVVNIVGIELHGAMLAFLLAGVSIYLVFSRNDLSPINIYLLLFLLSLGDFVRSFLLSGNIRYFPDLDAEKQSVLYAKSLLILFLWCIPLILSYRLVSGRSILLNSHFVQTRLLGVGVKLVLLIFALVTISVSIISALYLISEFGGLSAVLTSHSDRSEAFKGYGYLRYFAQIGVSGVLALFLLGRTRTAFLSAVIVFLSVAVFGGRAAAAIGVLLPAIIGYGYICRPISRGVLVVFASMSMMFVFGMQYFKYGSEFDFFQSYSKVIEAFTRGMADILPSLVNLVDEGVLPYQLGSTFLSAFYVLVPRVFWPGKPEGLAEDAMLGRLLIGEDYWGLPPGAFGVAFMNFSYIGVTVMAVITGLLVGMLFKRFKNACSANNATLMDALFVILFPVLIVRLFNWFVVYPFVGLVFNIVIVFVIYIFIHFMVFILRVKKF